MPRPVNNNLEAEQATDDDTENGEAEEAIIETERAIQVIVKMFSAHPGVLKAVEKFKTGKVPRRSAALDPTGRYMQEAGQFSLLTREDEIELFGLLYKGVERYFRDEIDLSSELTPEQHADFIEATIAYQKIFVANTRLVINLASRYNGYQPMPLNDLITEGNIGLDKAIRKFDITKGFKFSTYATWWVRQQVTRAIGDQSRLVRLPIYRHESFLKLKREMRELSEYLDREATAEDIAEVRGEDVKAIEKLLRDGNSFHLSIDATYDNGNPSTATDQGTAFGDTLPQLEADTVDTNMEMFAARLALREEVGDLLDVVNLDRREKFILSLRFGLDMPEMHGVYIGDTLYEDHAAYDADKTLEEVGTILGVTREHIRQIEAKALIKIRAHIDKSLLNADIS